MRQDTPNMVLERCPDNSYFIHFLSMRLDCDQYTRKGILNIDSKHWMDVQHILLYEFDMPNVVVAIIKEFHGALFHAKIFAMSAVQQSLLLSAVKHALLKNCAIGQHIYTHLKTTEWDFCEFGKPVAVLYHLRHKKIKKSALLILKESEEAFVIIFFYNILYYTTGSLSAHQFIFCVHEDKVQIEQFDHRCVHFHLSYYCCEDQALILYDNNFGLVKWIANKDIVIVDCMKMQYEIKTVEFYIYDN